MPRTVDKSESQELIATPNGTMPASGQLVPAAGTPNITSILAAAVERNMAPEALDKLLAVYERMEAVQAKRAFAVALAEFKDECPPIPRRTPNPYFKVKYVDRDGAERERPRMYASLEDIQDTIGKPLAAHGLSYRWGDAVVSESGKLMTLACIISHGGHEERSSVTLPLDSNAGASPAQKYGAVFSYAKRYSLEFALGLTSCEEDADGGNPEPCETIAPHELDNLKTFIDEVKPDMPRFLKFLGVERLEDIPASKVGTAFNALEAKRKAGGK
jgi:hypothetical protein